MQITNELLYQLLLIQIQALWNEEFIHKLKFGKYSRWALDLTPPEIVVMLTALGHYGKIGEKCPDIDTRPMFSGQGIDAQNLGIKLGLNKEQLQTLKFLTQLYMKSYREKLTVPAAYTSESPYFAENVDWAIDLTQSDLFGIIWHVGGFSSRSIGLLNREPAKASINEYHPRTQECLICLLRVTQKQPTYYQLAGDRFLLREYGNSRLEEGQL